jgi:hypothetical protein
MSSAYWKESIPDPSKLYKNGLKTETCDRPLYTVRVSTPTQKSSVLHHNRLHIKERQHQASQHTIHLWKHYRTPHLYSEKTPQSVSSSQMTLKYQSSTSPDNFAYLFFSKTMLSRRKYVILFCPKVQTCTYHFLQLILVYTSPITKDPCRASQLPRHLSNVNSVAPPPLLEYVVINIKQTQQYRLQHSIFLSRYEDLKTRSEIK